MELNVKKILGITMGSLLFYWALNHLETVQGLFRMVFGLLSPFCIGLGIAFILSVPMRFFERHLFAKAQRGSRSIGEKLRRPLSITLSILFVFSLIFLVLFIVIPEIAETVGTIRNGVPAFLSQMMVWGEQLNAKIPDAAAILQTLEIDWKRITDTVFRFLQSGATNLLNSTFSIASSVFSGVMNFFIGFVFSIYVLFQKERLASQMKRILYAYLPESWAGYLIQAGTLSNKTFTRFLTGQCLESVILGSMFFISMTVFRFPYAMMVSVLIAFTALIPVIGAFIGFVIGAFLIFVTNPVQALWFMVLFLVLQQIEGNLIYPRVVGNSVGLPAMWVLAAVMVGGSLLGIVGMLVFVPLCSVLYALFKASVERRLAEKQS